MKVPQSIQKKISGIVLLFGCLTILLDHARNQKWLADQRRARLEEEAADTGSRLSGVLQHLSRRQQERAADLEMAYASLSKDVEIGVVCGRDGLIRCSTQLQWRGLPVSETPLAVEWHRALAAMERMTTVLTWNEDRTRFIVAAPFFEGYDTTGRAVVLLRYDPTLLFAQVRDEAWRESVRHACFLLALTLLLWFALDEVVGRRVRELVRQVNSVGTGGRGLPLAGRDELSVVSREFDSAIQRLTAAEKLALNAAEQERRRIGGDLHDDLCQRLSATKMKTEVMLNLAARGGAEAADLAREVVSELQEAVAAARGFAHGLSPTGLDSLGLSQALEKLAHFTRASFQVPCAVEIDEHVDKALAVPERELLFRVTQELVVNACKHSRPAHMSVNSSLENGDVVLTVIHDGAPFQEPPPGQETGMGLVLMRQRLQALQASLERTEESGFVISIVRIARNDG